MQVSNLDSCHKKILNFIQEIFFISLAKNLLPLKLCAFYNNITYFFVLLPKVAVSEKKLAIFSDQVLQSIFNKV